MIRQPNNQIFASPKLISYPQTFEEKIVANMLSFIGTPQFYELMVCLTHSSDNRGSSVLHIRYNWPQFYGITATTCIYYHMQVIFTTGVLFYKIRVIVLILQHSRFTTLLKHHTAFLLVLLLFISPK